MKLSYAQNLEDYHLDLVFGDVQPDLHHDAAVFNQLILKVIDFGITAHPRLFVDQVFDPFDQDPTVPTAIKNCHAPGAADMAPESP